MNIPTNITEDFLKKNENFIFVFGDNILKKGYGGAAQLRDLKNTYGFLTKKFPDYNDNSYYTITEYSKVYKEEIDKLKNNIKNNSDKIYLISKLGAGLANKYKIFENVIEKNIKKDLKEFKNVEFLW